MAQKKHFRNPNGYGTVYKLSGNRRNPWVAKKFRDWKISNGKQIAQYDVIGYYPDRQAAYEALVMYNKDPYDLMQSLTTFKDVYNAWSDEHFKTIVPSAVRTWKSAYSHSGPLHDIAMADLRPAHMEKCIDEANVGNATKGRMKSMYNLMFRYAIKHEIVNKNYAELCKSVKQDKSKDKVPFSNEEVQLLWDNIEIPFADMVLIGLYSGWRPQELAILETSNIDLENECMTGGLKTDAGKNRCVPIHPLIMPLIKNRYDPSKKYLFNDENGQQGTAMTYDKYRGRFKKICERLKMDHSPHETRHSFITAAKACHMDEYVLKLIVGHTVQDLTEKVYTHRQLAQLKIEMNKLHY